ncbi:MULTISPECIES: hypothetical protein [Bacillus]|uniref:hypothetical protein n=1 Tax=Bacillus TaxID=1386 RepID=UPI000B4337CC|nr:MULTISPECIES: hypothetical protein [Bacillus]KAJ0073369.1 hypothetical protein DBB48_004765 [Bacillus altitudinis]MBU8576986.1 hypothetical protein [Bacillus pumilus]UDB49872.1 hypothetical protein BWL10_11020 [Bacillus safensis]
MNNLEIMVPYKVENNYEGFCFFADVFNSTDTLYDIRIKLFFNRTRWFEANLVSVLGAWIEKMLKRNCYIEFVSVNNSLRNVFQKNGFYKKYNLQERDDVYDSTIKYKVFNPNQEDDFSVYVAEQVLPKIRINITKSVLKTLRTSLNEVFLNAKIHSKSEKVYTCGQYYHIHQKVAFTITDLGNTIAYNVRNKHNFSNIHDYDAIEWATIYGNTTKNYDDLGGIGLHIIDEFMKMNSGNFQIVSGFGFWERVGGQVNKQYLSNFFPGTVVNIITSLENNLSMTEEILF